MPTLRVDLLIAVKPPWKQSRRHAQMSVCYMSLDQIKSTMEMDHMQECVTQSITSSALFAATLTSGKS